MRRCHRRQGDSAGRDARDAPEPASIPVRQLSRQCGTEAAADPENGGRGSGQQAGPTGEGYFATVNGTNAAVFSQAIASLPPASVMSAKAMVNWSIETAGVTIVIGTRTTSNFAS